MIGIGVAMFVVTSAQLALTEYKGAAASGMFFSLVCIGSSIFGLAN